MINSTQKKTWEKRYARLSSTRLYVYETKPAGKSAASPLEVIDLKMGDGRGKVVLEPLASEIDVPVASSDLPFIMSVETSLNTTCWPPKNFTFMVSLVEEKKEWYKGEYNNNNCLFAINELTISCLVHSNKKIPLIVTRMYLSFTSSL